MRILDWIIKEETKPIELEKEFYKLAAELCRATGKHEVVFRSWNNVPCSIRKLCKGDQRESWVEYELVYGGVVLKPEKAEYATMIHYLNQEADKY